MRWLALACGLFAAGVLGLYLLVAGHRADLSRMPDEVSVASTQAAPAPAGAPAAGGAAPADAAPDAAAGAAPADPLAAAVERLRAGLPAAPPAAGLQDAGPQDAPGEATADAAPPGPDAPQDGAEARDDPGAQGDAARLDNPAASSADAAGTPPARVEPSVSPGRHVTAQGVRWALSVAGGRPSLVIPLDDGGEARVQVASGFLALNLHAMSRNVEAVRFRILHDYLGRAGDYLFTPDGRLARL